MENLQGGTLALEHRYQIDTHRGSFGFVTLYEGTQDPFDLPVRIAVFDGLPEAGASDEIGRRIKESATRASLLRDDGLLATVDFGEIDRGLPFIIEEAVPGHSLADEIARRGALAPQEVADVVERLADLLTPLHRQGLFHGNLQPQWVLLPEGDDSHRRARVGHVGVGLTMEELLAMPQAVLTTDLVDAFAPEAFDSQINLPFPSAAADQWALAALAYRMFVGVHPFFDDPVDASEGIIRIKSDEAPSLKEMGIADEIADTISRGLRREPKRRFPSVQAFARALREAVDGPDATPLLDADHPPEATASPALQDLDTDDEPSPPTGPRPSGYLLTFALMALVLSNLGWFFLSLDETDAPAPEEATPPSPRTTLPAGLQLHTTPSGATIYAIPTDGTLPEEVPPLGDTPFVLPVDQRDQPHRFLVRLPGHLDQTFTIEETAAGQDLRLYLHEDPRPDAEN